MSKHIVLLSDGTGNSAAKLFKTNVLAESDPVNFGAGQARGIRLPPSTVSLGKRRCPPVRVLL